MRRILVLKSGRIYTYYTHLIKHVGYDAACKRSTDSFTVIINRDSLDGGQREGGERGMREVRGSRKEVRGAAGGR